MTIRIHMTWSVPVELDVSDDDAAREIVNHLINIKKSLQAERQINLAVGRALLREHKNHYTDPRAETKLAGVEELESEEQR